MLKRKLDEEPGDETSKRMNMDFSVPPPNMMPAPQPQQLQQPVIPGMPNVNISPQDAFYSNMNRSWREGRGNPRGGGGQNFNNYNSRGGQQNSWRGQRGAGGNNQQRNFGRGGQQAGYYRGSKSGTNQYGSHYYPPSSFNNASNNFNHFPQPDYAMQGQVQWTPQMDYQCQEDERGTSNSAQGQAAVNSGGLEDQVVMEEEISPKGKRRSMSQSYPTRPWDREAAEKALEVEMEFLKALRNQNLIIKFPDPPLNKEIVKAFHPGIVNVHFQVPSGPRFCFVQLEEGADADKVMEVLSGRSFGVGKLQVEKRGTKEEDNLSAESIDPFTLYIGNLPTSINMPTMREKFPTASRIDVGYAQRMKYTRYAFIRFSTAEAALTAFRETHNLQLDNRSVIVRFRRQRGPSVPSQNPAKKAKAEAGELPKQKKKAAATTAAAATAVVVDLEKEVAEKKDEPQVPVAAGKADEGDKDDDSSEDSDDSDDSDDDDEEEEDDDDSDDDDEEEEVDEDDDDDDDDEEEEEGDDDDEDEEDETANQKLPPGEEDDDDDYVGDIINDSDGEFE